MTSPEEYLQQTSLRPMLASLLERTCKDKPDNLLPFMLEYLVTTYPEASRAAEPVHAVSSFGSWAKRADVQPTQEGLQAYLAEIKARSTLETILEQALRQQPTNVVAFVIESLCAGGGGIAADAGSAAGSTAAAEVYAEVATRQDAHPQAPSLFEAVGEGDAEKIEALLAEGVPVDSLNDDAATALILAAEGEPALVALLLASGATVDYQNREGVTPLMAAVKYEDPEIVQALLDAGASCEVRDVAGLTAVDHALAGGDASICEKLGVSAETPPSAPPKSLVGQARRGSVSSESIDPKAKVDMSQIKVVPKDEAVKQRIKSTVASSILFKALDARELEAVVLSMEEVHVASGEAIIGQGAEGNHFYIVDSGAFDCFVQKPGDGLEAPGKKVRDYGPGDTFGELALMYNTPRAASVVATAASVLWAMDRATFRTVILQMMSVKRLRFEKMLESVPLLRSMEAYERTAVADAFEEKTFAAGEQIIREGEAGDSFFLLCSGTAVATKLGDAGARQMLEYKEGDYFGELALLKDKPRSATVTATTECECVYMDRPSFERLLGPVIHILQRNAENYKGYADAE